MPFKFNPFTGILDRIDEDDVKIPELTSDPASPDQESAWVLKTVGGSGAGEPVGLLLALTSPGDEITYQLSYRTKADTTVRVDLT